MVVAPLFRAKWEHVSKDLGIEVHVDHHVELPDGSVLVAPVHLPQFGFHRGMLVFTRADEMWPVHRVLVELGFGYSVLSEPSGREAYDRSSTIEMLADWTWNGTPEARPAWLVEAAPPTSDDDASSV